VLIKVYVLLTYIIVMYPWTSSWLPSNIQRVFISICVCVCVCVFVYVCAFLITFFFNYLFFLEDNLFTTLWWPLSHIYMDQSQVHMCPPILKLPSTSLPTPSLCFVPEHWLWVLCFMHWTCTGHLFYIW